MIHRCNKSTYMIIVQDSRPQLHTHIQLIQWIRTLPRIHITILAASYVSYHDCCVMLQINGYAIIECPKLQCKLLWSCGLLCSLISFWGSISECVLFYMWDPSMWRLRNNLPNWGRRAHWWTDSLACHRTSFHLCCTYCADFWCGVCSLKLFLSPLAWGE